MTFLWINAFKTSAQAINVQDSLALIDFYNSANGPQWKNTHWDMSTPVHDWDNVFVVNNRVTGINIQGESSSGIIPSSFGNLTALTLLILDGIKLTDTLPASFVNLSSLTDLELTNAFYNLPFPSALTGMPNLENLILTYSSFTDTIPSSIGNLTKLRSLDLSFCNLSGKLPAEMGSLTNLQDLDLNSNSLSGPIPASFANLTSLTEVYFDVNHLSGAIPLGILDISKIYVFSIPENDFTFGDIEPLAESYADHNYTYNFFYDSQADIPIQKKGDKLWVSPGGTLSHNTFQWYKGVGTLVSTIVGDTTFIPSSTGNYFVTVDNSVATGLTLYSDTIRYGLLLPDTTTTVLKNISGTDTVQIDTGIYRLVSLVPISGANALGGIVRTIVAIDSAVNTFHNQPYVQRHYDITPTVNAATAQAIVTLYFTQQDFDNFNKYVTTNKLGIPLLPANGVNNGNVRIIQLHGSFAATPDPQNYQDSTAVFITPNVTWDSTDNWWAVTFPVNGFSGFFLSTANFTLPLTLIDFHGKLQNGVVSLRWLTSNEVSTKEFTIERSSDRHLFNAIGKIEAAPTAGSHSYAFIDVGALTGINFYRLLITDVDGKSSFSAIVPVQITTSSLSLSIYPNPTNNISILQFNNSSAGRYVIQISDRSGKVIKKINGVSIAGINKISLDLHTYSAGMYFITLSGEDIDINKLKLVKE